MHIHITVLKLKWNKFLSGFMSRLLRAKDFLVSHWLLLLAIILLLPAIIIICFYTEPDKINIYELRMYIAYGFLLLAIMSFAVLRLYNAVVVNTTAIISAKIVNSNLASKIENLDRHFAKTSESIKSSMNNHADKMAAITKEIQNTFTKR